MPILTEEQLREAVAQRPGWRRQGDTLVREHAFRDYPEALQFLERVGLSAEDFFRHPDVAIIDGNRVRITIANPNHAGLTDAELRLAAKVDEVTSRADVPVPEAERTPAGGRAVSGPPGLAAFPPPAGEAGTRTAPEARTGPAEDARPAEGAAGAASTAGTAGAGSAEGSGAGPHVGPIPVPTPAAVTGAATASGPVVPVAIAAFTAGAVLGTLLRRRR